MAFFKASNFWVGTLLGGIVAWVLLPNPKLSGYASVIRKATTDSILYVSKTEKSDSSGLVGRMLNSVKDSSLAPSSLQTEESSQIQDPFQSFTFKELQVACDQKRDQLLQKSFDSRFKSIGAKNVDTIFEKFLPTLQTSAYWVAEGNIEIKQQTIPTTITLQIYNSQDNLLADVLEKLEEPSNICWIVEAWFQFPDKKLSYQSSNCFEGVLHRKGKTFVSMHTMNHSDYYDKLYFLTVTLPYQSAEVEYLPAGQEQWQTGEGFSWKSITQAELENLRGAKMQEALEN